MDSAVTAYIDATYQKIRRLKQSEKCEVWLAVDDSGKFVIIKRIFFAGLPYKVLKENPHPVCPKILYVSEDEGQTLVIEEFTHGKSLSDILPEKGSLAEGEVKNILVQLCDGLILYLYAGNLPVEESYWCAEFEILN